MTDAAVRMHLHHDNFAELEAAVAATDAEGPVNVFCELLALLEPEELEAVLDEFRPRQVSLAMRSDIPFHVRKREVELLLAAVYRLLNGTDTAGPLSLNRASVKIHRALLAYECSGYWRHWTSDQPLPTVGALKSNLHRILVLSKRRSGDASLVLSQRSIRRVLTDLKTVGQL